MNENISNLFDEELERELSKLKEHDPGSKEYLEALNAIERLHEMRLNSEKVDLEYTEKRESRVYNNGRSDEELRLKEAEETRLQDEQKKQRKEFWIKLGVDAGSLIASMVFFGLQWKNGYKFEQTGTCTSTTFREMRQKAFNSLFRK